MKVLTLLENKTIDKKLKAKHGVSFYIETDGLKIIYDTGPDDTFIDNGNKLGINIEDVDFLIISHGHMDHGGGLNSFISSNSKAKIILKESALNSYIAKVLFLKLDIGLPTPLDMDRVILIDKNYNVTENIKLVTNFINKGFQPEGNRTLFKKEPDGELVHDNFEHEIAMLVSKSDKTTLLSSCSHSGIGNIIKSAEAYYPDIDFETIIAGFHLTNPVTGKCSSSSDLDKLISELNKYPDTTFYTGHCTGEKAYNYMKSRLKPTLKKFQTGAMINT